MAENEANLLARFISVGASEVLKDMNAVGAAGVNNEKILNRLITLEQRKASVAKITAATILESERQKTAATKNRVREEELAHRKEMANSRDRIRQMAVETSERNRQAALLRRAGSGGALGAVGMLGIGGAAAYVGARVVGDVVQQAAMWERMDLALAAAEGSARGAKIALDDLYQIAKAPAIDLATAESAYVKLRATGMEAEKAKKVIQEFSNTVAISGGGSQQFDRALEQLVQMTTNGRVLQTDLKWMKESMPMLAQLLESAFGEQSAEGLRKLKVNADDFLLGVLEEMGKLPRAAQTVTSEIENAGVAWSKFKAGFVDTDFVKNGLNMWTSMLEQMTSQMENHSVKWGQLLKDSFHTGIPQLVANYAAGEYTETPEDQNTARRQRLIDLRRLKQDKGLLMGGSEARELFELEKWRREKDFPGAGEGSTMDLGEVTIKAKSPRDPEAEKAAAKKAKAEQAFALEAAAFELDVLGNRQKEAEALERGYVKFLRELEDERQNDAIEAASFDLERMADHQNEALELERKGHRDSAELFVEQQTALAEIRNDYLKSDYERQKDHYESVRQMILATTIEGSEEQTQLLAAVNRRQAQERIDTILSAEAQLASSVSGMFGDFASAYKMRSDYRYEREKASIEKTMSLNGLEGRARVEQQRRRDEALAKLDEKRQKDMAGTYQTMFLISKGFALAESMLMLSLAVSKAAAGAPFPANLANMAAVAAATGSVVGNIAAINYAGAYNKGGDIPAGSFGMVGDGGPEFVQGPAHVTSVKDTAAMLKPTVNVHNYSGQQVQVQSTPDGASIDVIVGKIAQKVEDQLATGMRSGRGQLSSAVKETFGLTRKGG